MPKLRVINISQQQRDNVHGWHSKIGAVMHETVSRQVPKSISDIMFISDYLDNKDYGIHGVVDNDGHVAWAMNLGKAIFYHTDSSGRKGSGNANTNFVGIELISRVMLDYSSRVQRIRAWLHMDLELNAAAKLLACLARAHGFPLVDNPGNTHLPGVTTHWEVSHYYDVPGGHVDCHPSHRGGYFPKKMLLTLARRYYRAGWRFGEGRNDL